MSNNKQSMKLYTEEQVLQAFKDGFLTAINEGSLDYINEYADELTPIELPSDKEIDNIAPRSGIALTSNAFKLGAKWMRDKIQGGNK